MTRLTPEQRYRQAMLLFHLRVQREVRLYTAGKVDMVRTDGDLGRKALTREIGRAYDAGFADGHDNAWGDEPSKVFNIQAAEIERLNTSLDHLRRQAKKRGDFSTCLACETDLYAGDLYFPDVNGVQCAECAPTYQQMIDEPEGHVYLDDEEQRTPEDCRAQFDAHIAAGGKPTDSMATEVLE